MRPARVPPMKREHVELAAMINGLHRITRKRRNQKPARIALFDRLATTPPPPASKGEPKRGRIGGLFRRRQGDRG